MTEEADVWAQHKKERAQKRWNNNNQSLAVLQQHGVEYQTLNVATSHYRIGIYDFWPTTGLFMNRDTGEKGRGVFNLLKALRIQKKEQFAVDHDDMPDGAFFALAEEQGIGVDEWVED